MVYIANIMYGYRPGEPYTLLDQREQGLKLIQEARDAIDRFNEILSTIPSPHSTAIEIEYDQQQIKKPPDNGVAMPTPSRAMNTDTVESRSGDTDKKVVEGDKEVGLPQCSITLDPDDIVMSVSCDNMSRSHDNGSVNRDSSGTRSEVNLSRVSENSKDEMVCSNSSTEIICTTTGTVSYHQKQGSTDQDIEGVDVIDGGKVGILFGDSVNHNETNEKVSTVTSGDNDALCDKREASRSGGEEEKMERSLVEFDNFLEEFNSPDDFLSKVHTYIYYAVLMYKVL